MRLFRNANYDFIGRRRTAYVVSSVLTLLAIVMALFWQVREGSWLNYGVDFTGGTLVQVRFTEPVSVGPLRAAMEQVAPRTEITGFGEQNEYLIRVPRFTSTETTSTADAVISALSTVVDRSKMQVVRTEAVGPKVGGELQNRAVLAILLSFLATLIYLAFRIELRFGIAAIIATLHDVILTLGLISAFQLEVSLPTVAAVLTILGYSLNDTIIIFDRIREELKALSRKETYEAILNKSINETLPRTIMTVTTTVVTLIALFIFGTGMIREFALILIIGIVLGTYSSIFVASPALLEIEKRWPREGGPLGRGRPARAARASEAKGTPVGRPVA